MPLRAQLGFNCCGASAGAPNSAHRRGNRMSELTVASFAQLCAAEAVRRPMSEMEVERRAAARKFWTRLPIGLALTVAVLWTLIAAGWEIVAIIAAMAFL